MRIGVFQFSSQEDIESNHKKIINAITSAYSQNVRLLVFQECATCGYPPIETPSIHKIDFETLSTQMQEIKQLAKKYNMYIALGTIREQESRYYNSIQLINPAGEIMGAYDKRALWGWDLENFTRGSALGVYEIDGVKVGFRICFEVRFPEYFRELFKSNVELCFVSFCDVSERELPERYNIIKSHLITRAIENVMTIVSANSISNHQTAPTAVFSPNGVVIEEAPLNQEYLLIYDYEVPKVGFGEKGRIQNSNQIIDEHEINYIK